VDAVQNQLTVIVSTLRDETRQQVEGLDERVQNQIVEISNKQEENKAAIENKTKELVNYELSKLKTNIVQENIIVHKEVESVTKETQSEFTEFESRLNQLQKKVVGGTSPQHNLVINGNESEVDGCASPKNAGGTSLNRTGDVSDDIVMDSNRHTIRNNAGACHTLFNGNVIGDLPLPKFSDPRKQNVVEFLAELNDYFKLKNIPDSLKLALAMKAVTDPYCKNFISAVYKGMETFEQLSQELTRFLWDDRRQADARASIYQDKYKEGTSETSAHFLSYTVQATHLTHKLSELELVNAISRHYPMSVQRAFMSANVRTITEAVSLLKSLEGLGSTEDKGSNYPSRDYVGSYHANHQSGDHRGHDRNTRQADFGRRENYYGSNRGQNGRQPVGQRQSGPGRQDWRNTQDGGSRNYRQLNPGVRPFEPRHENRPQISQVNVTSPENQDAVN
jgi:hypothetical protein